MTENLDQSDFKMMITNIVNSFYRKITSEDGVSAKMIQKAELNLQVKFPAIMSQYFSVLGNAVDINHSFYQILSPAEIFIETIGAVNFVVIAYSNQKISSFGFRYEDISTENLIVYEICEEEASVAFESMPSFYIFIVLWQIINDLIEYRISSYASDTVIELIKNESFKFEISGVNTSDLIFYWQSNLLILITTEGSRNLLSAGGKKLNELNEFCSSYSLKIQRLRTRPRQ